PLLLALFLMKRKNLVNNPCDLTFPNLESHTIELDNRNSVSQVRSAIMTLLEKGTVYINNLSDNDSFVKKVTESFLSAGIKSIEIKPDTTDLILGKDFREEIKGALIDNSYIFVPVHGDSAVNDLAPVINSTDTLCVIALNSGSVTRRRLAGIVSGIKPENLIIVIIN
ncbi:MAG: hypothetical protein K2H39_03285, partial [Paramuribaculum sp.]|nr:hypothetical protein [Paramuribaculum sp.]